jgi:hypothetical protein
MRRAVLALLGRILLCLVVALLPYAVMAFAPTRYLLADDRVALITFGAVGLVCGLLAGIVAVPTVLGSGYLALWLLTLTHVLGPRDEYGMAIMVQTIQAMGFSVIGFLARIVMRWVRLRSLRTHHADP